MNSKIYNFIQNIDMFEKKIVISVTQPQIHNDSAISYVTYHITGHDPKGPFSVRRRYRDFHLLRQKLVQRWPGLYVPPIASKKVSGNTEDRFVESRKKFLHYFCKKIIQRPYFYSSDVFQLFIKGAGDFEKSSRQLEEIDYEKLSEVYVKNFTELTQDVSSAQLTFSTETDYDFMKKSEKKLEKLRDQFKAASDAKHQYDQQYNSCMHNILPQYEEKVLLKYVEEDRSKLLLKQSDQFDKKLKQYGQYTENNVLEQYVELMSYELREMRAFVEAIDSRKKAEQETKSKIQSKRRNAKQELQKLKSGKTTIKSVFSMGTKDQQAQDLENLIPKWEKSEQALANMIFLMNAAIFSELQNYKKERLQTYQKDVGDINKKQIKQMNFYGSLLALPLGIVFEE